MYMTCIPVTLVTFYMYNIMPPYRTSDLRNRGHLFQLLEYTTDLHKKSFIIQTLYKYVFVFLDVLDVFNFF